MVTSTNPPSTALVGVTERITSVPASESLSTIVTVALLIAPRLAPNTFVRKTLNVSLPSTTQSSINGINSVAVVCPFVNSSVLEVAT